MIRKAVLPAAGLGTRLLPITKELPKEMLPIFVRGCDGEQCLKPMLQAIFEQLHGVGFRDFCFVVGREKRAIEDHFTPDLDYLKRLKARRKLNCFGNVKAFYDTISSSTVVWVNQPEPKGFGNSVLMTETFVGKSSFLCHAGDTYIESKGNQHLKMLTSLFQDRDADAIFLAQRLRDPRGYGVIEGVKVATRLYDVKRVVEKPERPRSNLAIMPLYVFNSSIFKALRKTRPGAGGEYQLTDAIERLIDAGSRVYALELGPKAFRLDIGTPETYWHALTLSHARF
jgi:UTP--glucose-1-phosphate uridylyltransferase